MPKVDSTPKTLRPYESHGVVLDWKEGGKQASGNCPFCSAEGKFTVNVARGVFRCFSCNCGKENGKAIKGGDATVFLDLLHQTAVKSQINGFDVLCESRGLLDEGTPSAWGCVKSHLTGEWLVPGYDASGGLHNLYRWVKERKSGKNVLYGTPDTTHGLFGVPLLKGRETCFLTEGPWDAMAWWEANEGDVDVLAVPGCTTFLPEWCPLFAGKDVVLLYDSDHPREGPAGRVDGAGFAGVKRVCKILRESSAPPRSVSFLKWGPEGYEPTMPTGTDVRDLLKTGDTLRKRQEIVQGIMEHVEVCPTEWHSEEELVCLPCESWTDLHKACTEGMYWGEGLDRAFVSMLACIISTPLIGDQLWIMVVSPPSTGKSTLCDMVDQSKQWVKNVGILKGFHSGMQTDKEGTENLSLAYALDQKTMVIKDGDTLLASPFLPQILSEARDIYDGKFSVRFKNKRSEDYDKHRMTFILCGTSSLRKMDASELGQRFLSVVIMDEIDEEMETAINLSRCDQLEKMYGGESGDGEDSPERTRMKRMTAGYINKLRPKAVELFAQVRMPRDMKMDLLKLAEFAAFMRARPSETQVEDVQRELSTRLMGQLHRLAYGTAVVLNKTVVDEEVMRRVKRTALDTARGLTLKLAERMLRAGDTGTTAGALATHVGLSSAETYKLLKFLYRINAVEHIQARNDHGQAVDKPKWRLTPRLVKLVQFALE